MRQHNLTNILHFAIVPHISKATPTSNMTTITERYPHADHFSNLLNELGMTNTQAARLQSGGFTSMQILVSHYQSGGASNLEKYLRDLNKTFANSAVALRVYYNPVIINRLCGCLNYFSLCVMSFYTIPDIDLVNQEFAGNLGSFWNKFKADKKIQDENDDDTNIDLPKLKGAASWISFRDAFIHKLRDTSTSRGFSLAYLVDTTVRPVTHGNSALLESDIIDLEEEDVFETKTIHFGSSYRGDNKKLWNMLEAALLNSDPYNMIAQFFRTKDGRKAWIALKSHYEGEDYVLQIREEAMSRLKTVHYRGETRNFKWENYVSAHIKAHKQLLDVGYNNRHGLDDATKTQFLRSNIVPQADMHISLAVARPYEKKPFQEYITFLTTEVIRALWDFSQSMWVKRCQNVHVKNTDDPCSLTHNELLYSIREILKVRRTNLSHVEKQLHLNVTRGMQVAHTRTLVDWLLLLSQEREKTIRFNHD